MSKNDGGGAFPELRTDLRFSTEGGHFTDTYSEGGMTLRDYFAAKVLAASLGQDVSFHAEVLALAEQRNVKPAQAFASMAYEYADAMLAEREK